MQNLNIFVFLYLICFIFGAESCSIYKTKDQNITNFAGCKGYSTSSTDKICCYINGYNKDENKISGCTELTGTEKGAIKDLFDFEHLYGNEYYVEADCNLGKVLGLCNPDDRKSNTPLSPEICSKYIPASFGTVDEGYKCCYVTGVRVDKTKVYSCAGIGMFDSIDSVKSDIEKGDYRRLGALNDINIVCDSSSNSYKFISISIISTIITLLNLLI